MAKTIEAKKQRRSWYTPFSVQTNQMRGGRDLCLREVCYRVANVGDQLLVVLPLCTLLTYAVCRTSRACVHVFRLHSRTAHLRVRLLLCACCRTETLALKTTPSSYRLLSPLPIRFRFSFKHHRFMAYTRVMEPSRGQLTRGAFVPRVFFGEIDSGGLLLVFWVAKLCGV